MPDDRDDFRLSSPHLIESRALRALNNQLPDGDPDLEVIDA